jgi:hypothetical protein
MSPRRNHPKRRTKPHEKREEREFGIAGESIEDEDGIYTVRRITGASSTKPYRCPGCDQLIPTATPHVVAWIEGDVESRRHWHSACWEKRHHRRPNTERSRNAPRY